MPLACDLPVSRVVAIGMRTVRALALVLMPACHVRRPDDWQVYEGPLSLRFGLPIARRVVQANIATGYCQQR